MDWLYTKNIHLPDLLFLDLNMPRKNGLECLKEIRSNEKLKDIAVAIYSTSESEHDIEQTFLSGANIYLIKPNDFKMLKQILEKAVLMTLQYKDKSMDIENFILKIE